MKIQKHTGTTFQLIAVAMLPILCLIQVLCNDRVGWGLYDGAPVINHLTYHFIHGGMLHLLFNWWCLVALSFAFPYKWYDILVAFLIAAAYPFAGDQSIIGLSAFDYALCAIMIMEYNFSEKLNSWGLLLIVILLQGLFYNIALGAHLWAYMLASFYGVWQWWRK